MDFQPDEELIWDHGNGTSGRVRFVRMAGGPYARPEITKGGFPGNQGGTTCGHCSARE